MTDLRRELLQVLTRHEARVGFENLWCSCGLGMERGLSRRAFQGHQLEVLAPVLDQARAEGAADFADSMSEVIRDPDMHLNNPSEQQMREFFRELGRLARHAFDAAGRIASRV